ncbi:MAG: dihydropteroate synthase [Sulfolobales archaeon]
MLYIVLCGVARIGMGSIEVGSAAGYLGKFLSEELRLRGRKVIVGKLGRLELGDGRPVRIAGVINVSPESFYKGSVVRPEEAGGVAVRMVEEGAELVDIGGRSTAPYLRTDIPLEEEVKRVREAVKSVKDAVNVTVSVDTFRARVAEEALRLGAEVVNDVTGLRDDEGMIRVLKEYRPSLIVCAREVKPGVGRPIDRVVRALAETLELLRRIDYDIEKVVVDPCIGFFRYPDIPWYVWDLSVIASLREMRTLGRPIAIGVSRKSFIGVLTGRDKPEERLYGSLALTAIAVLNGANMVRTHDVLPTKDAVRAIEGYVRYAGQQLT